MSLYQEIKNWDTFSSEEKLTKISAFIENEVKDIESLTKEEKDILRACIPAYIPKEDSTDKYIFISYSHKDAKKVYLDLTYFMYNSKTRVRFWYDEGLKFGESWVKDAGVHLEDKNCAGVLFYLSENLLLSSAVFKEIKLVKKLKKFWFSVALNPDTPSALSIFKKYNLEELFKKGISTEKLNILVKFFPQKNTSLVHYFWNDDVRIKKLGEYFSVVYDANLSGTVVRDDRHLSLEEAKKQFEFEETDYEDFFSLEPQPKEPKEWYIIRYVGNSMDVVIPESIDNIPVVSIDGNMLPNHVKKLNISKTVTYIQTESGEYFEDAEILERITVDKENPVYYDLNGVLCGRKNKEIIRAPINWDWGEQFSLQRNNDGKLALDATLQDFWYSQEDILLLLLDEKYNVYRLDEDKSDSGDVYDYYRKRFKKLTDDLNFGSLYNLFCAAQANNVFKGINVIGSGAFENCKKINFLFLPQSVCIINDMAFYYSNISLVFLPDKTELRLSAFSYCRYLRSILTTAIKFDEYCNNSYGRLFSTVYLSDTIVIGKGAFKECYIKEVTVADGNLSNLKELLSNDKISKVYLKKGVAGICPECFNDCKNLEEIYIPTTVAYISPDAFKGCNKLNCIYFSGTALQWYELWEHSAKWYAEYLNRETEALYKQRDELEDLLSEMDEDDGAYIFDKIEILEIDDKTMEIECVLRDGYPSVANKVPEELRDVKIICTDGIIKPSKK